MKYSILFFLVLVIGCTSNPTYDNKSLIKWFNEYKSFYKTENEDDFFNPILWASIKKSRINSTKSAFAGALSKFPNEIIDISDYKEAISDKEGCLLISGINSEKTPLDYYLTYQSIENKWVIKDVTVKYFFDNTERFLQEAVCDEQKRAQLWLQFMEQKK
ncbi:MAG: hypothetical protein L3J89_08520 [Gammaproteobacteria bacterium]|nr:hypothetical protein [Gammaproteobacteria bacterium]